MAKPLPSCCTPGSHAQQGPQPAKPPRRRLQRKPAGAGAGLAAFQPCFDAEFTPGILAACKSSTAGRALHAQHAQQLAEPAKSSTLATRPEPRPRFLAEPGGSCRDQAAPSPETLSALRALLLQALPGLAQPGLSAGAGMLLACLEGIPAAELTSAVGQLLGNLLKDSLDSSATEEAEQAGSRRPAIARRLHVLLRMKTS